MGLLRRLALVVVGFAAVGCAAPDTSLHVLVSSTTKPTSLDVSLFASGRLLDEKVSLADRTLPGTLVLFGFDRGVSLVRVLVSGENAAGQIVAQGAAIAPLVPGTANDIALELQPGKLPDSDGDGVPDAIDDCPTIADQDQTCPTSQFAGHDLATTRDDLGTSPAPRDLGMNMQPRDLAGVTLDLTTVPDLRLLPPECPATALFCDGFETQDFSRWTSATPQKSAPTTSNISIETANSTFQGNASAHVSAAASNAATVTLPYVMPQPITQDRTSTLWLRAYVMSTAVPTQQLYFLGLRSANKATAGMLVGTSQGASETDWSLVGADGTATSDTPTTFSANHWYCVELSVTLDEGGTRSAEWVLNVDGSVVSDTLQSGPAAPADVGELDIGVLSSDVSAANDIYVDDVVLSAKEPGCE